MKNRVLIVDDEKNIRMTIVQSLADMDVETDTAINGEEALAKIKESDFNIVLLDLRMPGMDGMDVLAKLRQDRPGIKVVIITAHGTIDSAVKAMKLKAVDFIEKPFTPDEIRQLISRLIDRKGLDKEKSREYDACLDRAKTCIADRQLETAKDHIKKAIALDSSRPQAYNLLGAVNEIKGDKLEAQKNYRTALSLDPAYKPAQDNLYRSTGSMPGTDQKIRLD